jgi:hypothetical protein
VAGAGEAGAEADGAGVECAGAGGFGAEDAGADGAGEDGAGEDGAVTAALGFSAAFVAGLPAWEGNAAPPPAAGLVRKSSRFAANTVNASTDIKKISANTLFLVLIQLPQRWAETEDDAIACLAP